MKKILKAVLILIGMIAMLFVLAVIVNLSVFDEELLPEVQAIKDIQAKPYQADNAYPALFAMSYFPDQTYLSATKNIRQLLNKNISNKAQDYLSESDTQLLKDNKIERTQLTEFTQCHTRKERNCIQQSIDQLEKQAITDQDALTLLDRYSQLIDYRHFSEATQLNLTASLPAFGPVLNAQRVLLLKHWLEKKPDFISLLNQDLTFWRMILASNHFLITKMISTAAIHNDIQIMAYAIQSGDLSQEQLLSLRKQIKGLTVKERSMLTTLKFEMKYSIKYSEKYEVENGNFFSKLLLQPQATHNLHYLTNIKPLSSLDELDSSAFYETYQSKEWLNPPKTKSAISLYNPSGKLLVTYLPGVYQDYFARVHDLDVMLTLLNLRIELALNNDQNIATLIKNSKHKNPYTNLPFDYYAKTNTIRFDCLDKTSVCEISL